MIKYYL